MSRDLRLSFRIFFFFSLSVCLLPLRLSVFKNKIISVIKVTSGAFRKAVKTPLTHQLLHVTSKVEAGEGFLFLCIILGPLFGLLLLLANPLILEREKDDPR